jgi:hypothetical protein
MGYKAVKAVNFMVMILWNASPCTLVNNCQQKKGFNNKKKFKGVLQKFLYENSFYSLDEYFDHQKCQIYIWTHFFQLPL